MKNNMNVIAVSAGSFHSLALKADGTVVAWGMNDDGQATVPEGLSGVTEIAAGSAHSLALKADGTVVAWGDNVYGQATVPEGLSDVTAIAAGYFHSVALKNDGTVVAWGYNGYGQSTVPAGLSGVTAIASGSAQILALKADGTVVAWGDNDCGQCTVPSGISGVTAISAGECLKAFHNYISFPSITGGCQELAGLTLYSVSLFHQGDHSLLGVFSSLDEAEEFAKNAWQIDKSHPDFTRGGEERAEWVIAEHVFDGDGMDESSSVSSFIADEK
jgi:hypothetical protein